MYLILLKTTNVEKRKNSETRIAWLCKKRKDAEKFLTKKGDELGMTNQWDLLRDTGSGVAGGFEHRYAIVKVTEGVDLGNNIDPIEHMLP